MPLQRDPRPQHRDPAIIGALVSAGELLASISGGKVVVIDGSEYTAFIDSQDVRQQYAEDGGSVDGATTNLLIPNCDLRSKSKAECHFDGESYRVSEVSYDGANSSLTLITESAE